MSIKIISIILISCLNQQLLVSGFDPFTLTGYIGFSIGSVIIGSKYSENIKVGTYCKYYECCSPQLIPQVEIFKFKQMLDNQLFGQKIIVDKLTTTLLSHYKNIENSRKPLVMSFHGTTGIGKNHVANLIADAIFEKGRKSKFYHVIHGSQYSTKNRITLESYQHSIEKVVLDGIDQCPYSLFVFDEVDKMPVNVFETITSMLDHHTLVKGRDFTKAIFIFLTNYGGESIYKLTHEYLNNKKVFRHELQLHHYEDIVKQETYNKEGGLGESSLIKTAAIDFYFPFLPLEESHVIQCIQVEFMNSCKREATQENIEEILKYVSFDEITKYSHTGCKTLHNKVKAEC